MQSSRSQMGGFCLEVDAPYVVYTTKKKLSLTSTVNRYVSGRCEIIEK